MSHFVLLSAICVQKPLLAFQKAKLAFEAHLLEQGLTYSIVRPTVESRLSPRHCEERSDEAIQSRVRGPGLLRFARNDDGESCVGAVRLKLTEVRHEGPISRRVFASELC